MYRKYANSKEVKIKGVSVFDLKMNDSFKYPNLHIFLILKDLNLKTTVWQIYLN